MESVLKLALVACGVTLLAGCAKTEDTTLDTAAADTALVPGGPAAAPSTASPAVGGAAGTTVGESDPVHVPLREWSLRVSKSPIRAGTTTFHAMNEGKYQHAVEIEGNGQEWKIEPIGAAGSGTVAANLTPGTYTVYCPIVDSHGNHQKRGMTTSLVVR